MWSFDCLRPEVAFWLNIRNLAVIIAVLQLYTQPVPLKLPNTRDEWMSCLCGTSLFVHGRALGPADIDHEILSVGQLSLLPSPSRPSLVHSEIKLTTAVKSFMPWLVFGLWLPIEFGSPRLYIFKAETVMEQLRSSAEVFLKGCTACTSESEVTGGYACERLQLPPTLRSTAATLQPLLKSRGPFSQKAIESRAVDWTFKVEDMKQSEKRWGAE